MTRTDVRKVYCTDCKEETFLEIDTDELGQRWFCNECKGTKVYIDYTVCQECGNIIDQSNCDDGRMLTCSECQHINKDEPQYKGDLNLLGKRYGKTSWCSTCQRLTKNVKGTTYCNDENKLERFIGQKVWRRDSKVLTKENVGKHFFACSECGKEKFWAWGYQCPRCDYDRNDIIEIEEAHYNIGKAMEFGGTPMDWDELWYCPMCGMEYWIDNSNC
jgi:hypothetical protein